ncbi:MAG: nucleotide sugar dehydrogenase [Pseudomonas marincola]
MNQNQINSEVEQALIQHVDQGGECPENSDHYDNKAISVFGLGYVGIVSSVCLNELGHYVIGVDTNEASVNSLNDGKAPIVEPHLEEMIQKGLEINKFFATTNITSAIQNSTISFVCVGTPSTPEGALDLTYLKIVSSDIGACLKTKDEFHTIVYRSTMEPGTADKVLTPLIEEASGKKVGKDFAVCFHPEFLREGTAIEDFFAPPKTVIGARNPASANVVSDLYKGKFDDNLIVTSLEVAEMVKYVDNTWHAVKVSFANEIGRICQACDTDGHEVMEIFCKDKKLNLSPYYLKPGFAFGGSCLPKDVRGINKLAKIANVETPLLNSILNSNEVQINHAADMVVDAGGRNVAVLGLTFKKGTDDLRETPTIPMIAKLLKAGFKVKVYDENIKNNKPLLHYLQHAECADQSVIDFCKNFDKYQALSIGEVLLDAETIVITHDSEMFKSLVTERLENQTVVDLVRLFKNQDGPRKIFEAGMNDFLQKPARSSELHEILNQHIDVSQDKEKKTILLAEDNIPMNTVIQLKLSSLGYHVDTVTNGEDAVYMAKNKVYDAIFMDLEMPKLDGYEATRHIRKLPLKSANVPIIALSANIIPEQSHTYHGLCW